MTFASPSLLRRSAVMLAIVLSVSACQTLGSNLARIETNPPGALVRVEGFGSCESPCTIELDAVRKVTVAKAGYLKEEFEIAPGAGVIRLDMALAAPTEDVESTALPDL